MITGATSQVGVFLLPLLVRRGDAVVALTRNVGQARAGTGSSERQDDSVRWVECDLLNRDEDGEHLTGQTLIHVAPLVVLPRLIPMFAARGGRRLIAFGSTGRYSKSHSANEREKAFVAQIADAESDVVRLCREHEIEWTIFRPTMIYGAGMDKSVTLIADLIRRYRFFPLFGPSRGLRQPVHAGDLAQACLLAIENPDTHCRIYNLGGGETLEYREMVSRIFVALGRKPRFVRVPLLFFRIAMWAISRIPRYRDFNPEMARRMNDDLVFDHSEANRDFGYSPRPFQPVFGAAHGHMA